MQATHFKQSNAAMDGATKTILIAEDNRALRSVIQFNLERAGFDVVATPNGQAAFEQFETREFDLVLTDHQMPIMTGIELCERIRALDNIRQVPVVLLTAKGMELDLADLKDRLGIAAALPKPFSPKELVATLEACLKRPRELSNA